MAKCYGEENVVTNTLIQVFGVGSLFSLALVSVLFVMFILWITINYARLIRRSRNRCVVYVERSAIARRAWRIPLIRKHDLIDF
ncbi:hypothetical protein QR680_007395 [Steinernema hermaphroditum]|uniref:Uncharacterized protein n=1 Tax=Steinernema hermaphroditum TaxID=289476 RepID=A0AA39M636_9BILA|nr:hypothetical protein QR680_007395 [Steinernema hermaphroditum]